MKKPIKIHPHVSTTLSRPYKGKYLHPAGTSVVINSEHKTKTFGSFLMMIPNPTTLYLNNAQKHIEKGVNFKNELLMEEKINVFPKKVSNDELERMGLKTPIHILAFDPGAKIFRDYDNQKLFEFIQTGIDATTSLVSSVESFINGAIPIDYTDKLTKQGKEIMIDKDYVVRWYPLEKKMELLGKILGKSDFKSKGFWQSFKTIKEVRDASIHFKQKQGNTLNQLWDFILITLIDNDLEKMLDDFIALIKYFKPEFPLP